MVIGIVGAGALGTMFANALRKCADVRLIGRGDAIDGLRDADIVLVAVKTYDTISALRALRGVLGASTPIVSLQNGIDQVAQITEALGEKQPIALAPTTEAATREDDGAVRRAGRGRTVLGWSRDRVGTFDLDALAALLRSVDFEVDPAAPIEPYVWGKLVVNAAINPLTALLGRPNGVVAEDPVIAATAAALAREAAAVAAAEGVSLPFEDPVAQVLAVALATSENRSSMLQDIERRRQTEIDAINGAVVRRGREHGIPIPENERILDEVRRISEA